MAKRAPAGEATYDPLDHGLAQSITNPTRHNHEGAADTGGAGEGTENGPPSTAFGFRLRQSPAAASRATPGHPMPNPRGFAKTKRVLLTAEEERDIERLVVRIAEHVGASLKLSHVLRACMALLCHAETELLRHASNHHLVRPRNGDAVALAEFEQGVAKLLSLALRDAPVIR